VVRAPRLTEGNSLPRQLPRLRFTSPSGNFAVLAATGVFCLAATGVAAAASAASPTPTPPLTPRQIAGQMLAQYGWDLGQFSCLDPLWTHESGWNVYAENPGSGAYGIPQALPGDKMASAGPDWRTNPATQIRWGLTYIQDRYGSPCAAWSHEQGTGWY
jgi:hypothetical protein